jgi:hypothetical protein
MSRPFHGKHHAEFAVAIIGTRIAKNAQGHQDAFSALLFFLDDSRLRN